MDTYSRIEKIKENFNNKRMNLADEKENLMRQIEDIQSQIRKKNRGS